MGSEIDTVLSGIIIVLLLVVVWKWYSGKPGCDESSITMSCGCKNGRCRCRGVARRAIPMPRYQQQPDGRRPGCQSGVAEGLSADEYTAAVAKITSDGYQPYSDNVSSDYDSETQLMSLEQGAEGPVASHKRWVDSLAGHGLSTGASASSLLEETGRSYGTSDFVGLTARKWCKARQLTKPADDARVTPSHDAEDYCNIDMDELI